MQVFGTAEEKYPCGSSPGMVRTQPRVSIPAGSLVSQGRLGRSKHASADSNYLRYQVRLEIQQTSGLHGMVGVRYQEKKKVSSPELVNIVHTFMLVYP